MYFKLNKFVLDEKDIFLVLFGAFLIASVVFNVPSLPFRFDSLVVIFVFLAITRFLNTYFGNFAFYVCVITALWLSMLISPYTLAIYLGVYFLILKKMGKI